MRESKTEIINAKVSKRERLELKQLAKNNKTTLSEIIRMGINNYKKTIKTEGK